MHLKYKMRQRDPTILMNPINMLNTVQTYMITSDLPVFYNSCTADGTSV